MDINPFIRLLLLFYNSPTNLLSTFIAYREFYLHIYWFEMMNNLRPPHLQPS